MELLRTECMNCRDYPVSCRLHLNLSVSLYTLTCGSVCALLALNRSSFNMIWMFRFKDKVEVSMERTSVNLSGQCKSLYRLYYPGPCIRK